MLYTPAVTEWMDKLGGILENFKIKPHHLYNMDETMMELSNQHLKVISKKGAPRANIATDVPSEHITLVLCVPAVGYHVRPLCILPLKTLPRLSPASEVFFLISGQENGSITKEIFFNWVTNVFIPHVNDVRAIHLEPDEWVLLLVDGHNSRDCMPTIIAFDSHRVLVLVLLAHSSTVSQPLDLEPNQVYKHCLTKHFKIKKGEPKEEQRIRLLDTSIEALQVALSPIYVKAGFARAGIWPFSRDAPLKSNLVRDPHEDAVKAAPPKRPGRIGISGKLLNNRVNLATPLPILSPPHFPTPLLAPHVTHNPQNVFDVPSIAAPISVIVKK